MARGRKRRVRTLPAAGAPPAASTELQRAAARLRRDQSRTARSADQGEPTPEQQAKFRYGPKQIVEPGKARTRIVRANLSGRRIDAFLARTYISQRQFDAADRYRCDHDRAGFERSVIGRYDGGGGSSATGPNMAGLLAANHAQLDARQRLRDARAVINRRLAGYFDAVVLHDDEAAAVAAASGRPGVHGVRFVLEWIRICCDELADYYRL